MGSILDILAAVVKDHEAKKAYGTPFYKQKLDQLAAEQESGSLRNQQAQQNLAQDAEMFPIQKQVQESLIPGREASARLTGERADAMEAANSPERLAAADELKRAQADYAAQRSTQGKLESAARIAQINARIKKMEQGPSIAAPKPKRQYDPTRGIIVDVNAGTTSQVTGPDGAPLKQNLTSDAKSKIALLQAMQSSLGKLKSLSEGDAGNSIGYFKGRAVGATREMFGAPANVQEMFNISDTLMNDYMNAKSGAAISPSEAVRLEKVLPRPTSNRSKFDADVKRFEIELSNAIAARKGEELSQGGEAGVDPEVEKRLKALGL